MIFVSFQVQCCSIDRDYHYLVKIVIGEGNSENLDTCRTKRKYILFDNRHCQCDRTVAFSN